MDGIPKMHNKTPSFSHRVVPHTRSYAPRLIARKRQRMTSFPSRGMTHLVWYALNRSITATKIMATAITRPLLLTCLLKNLSIPIAGLIHVGPHGARQSADYQTLGSSFR